MPKSELPSEPDDLTMLVTIEDDGRRRVIWRDDGDAYTWGSEHEDERWFDDVEQDPMSWAAITKYSKELYLVEQRHEYSGEDEDA